MQNAAINSHTLPDEQVLSLNAFVEKFYVLTDDSAAHSEYTSQFLPISTLAVNNRVVRGIKGILLFRQSVWSFFISQKHIIESITYTQKPPTTIESQDYITVEAVLFGTVKTVSKIGETRTVEWAGRAEYIGRNGIDWNVFRYQVYLNTKPRKAPKI